MAKKSLSDSIQQTMIGKVEPHEYYISTESDKDKVKIIKRVERIIRRSMEYKDYIKYLRDYVDIDNCSFFEKISKEEVKRTRIEINHEPFT